MKTDRLLKAFLSFSIALLLATPAIADPALAESPLAAYRGFGHDAEADEKQFQREEMARELVIAECMERQELFYAPTPSMLLEEFETPSAAMAALRDNPNERYERRLPEGERLRYRVALYGVEDPTSERAEDQPEPFGPGGGCLGEAMRTLPGVFAAKAALQEQFDAMRRAVMSDARVQAAEGRWAACMQRLGHGLDASPRALEARQDDELGQLIGVTKVDLPSREELAALGEQHRAERQLAMRCAREVDLPGVVAQVRVDHETRFVAEHRETLDRHRAQFLAQQSLLEQIEARQR